MPKRTKVIHDLFTTYDIAKVSIVEISHQIRINGAGIDIQAWDKQGNQILTPCKFDIEMELANLLRPNIISRTVKFRDITSLVPDSIEVVSASKMNLREHPDQYFLVSEDDITT